jgi:hypothetical protein
MVCKQLEKTLFIGILKIYPGRNDKLYCILPIHGNLIQKTIFLRRADCTSFVSNVKCIVVYYRNKNNRVT